MSRHMLWICMVLLLAGAMPLSTPTQAQGGTTPTLITQFQVPGAQATKFPKVAVGNSVLHYAANNAQLNTFYWAKPESAATAAAFGNAFEVGTASGAISDFLSPSIFLGSNNNLYYAWSDVENRRINLRVRNADGSWQPQRTVFSNSIFGIFTQVAATTDRVFVTWQDARRAGNEPELFARTSTDNGATWSSTIFASSGNVYSSPAAIGIGPNNEVAVIYTTLDLQINAGFWDGSGFNSERVSGSGIFSSPTITIGANGKIYAGYRGAEGSGPSSGVHLAERQAANQWTRAQLVDRPSDGAVNVVLDASGALHMGWVARPGGENQVFYRLIKDGAAVGTVAGASGPNFNAHLAVDQAGSGFAHMAAERFDSGDVSRPFYYLFSTPSVSATPNAVPVIEAAAAVVRMKDSVSVTFNEVANNPTEILWKWGSAPSEADNDSGGWQPFTNGITVPVPSTIPTDCSDVTLYTQVRNGDATQNAAASDSVKFDGDISAAVAASNPYLLQRSPIFSDMTLNDFGGDGSSDGAPGYTRVPVFYLEMQGRADCSGLRDIATGLSTTNILPPYTVENDKFANVVPFPTLPVEGNNTVLVRVSDSAGNIRDFNQSFVYDVQAPLVTTSATDSLTLGTTNATLLVNLQVSNVQISDDHYPSPGFWGVWVANSRTPLSDPTQDGGLIWTPIAVNASSGTFSVPGWSLASGLTNAQVTPGDYYVYLRFLDGAGNPSTTVLSAQTTLSQVTKPALFLPLTIK